MTLQGVTYQGEPLGDPSILFETTPEPLIEVLWQINGFVAYAGGLHVRGLVDEPEWHSVERYRTGEMALSKLYEAVEETDFPFAQDFLANQFLLRDERVYRLRADTGDVEDLDTDLAGFFDAAREDPIGYLSLELLASYMQTAGRLEPGQLLHPMPPLCLSPDRGGRTLRAVPADNALSFLANFARQVRALPEGAEVDLRLFEPPSSDRVN